MHICTTVMYVPKCRFSCQTREFGILPQQLLPIQSALCRYSIGQGTVLDLGCTYVQLQYLGTCQPKLPSPCLGFNPFSHQELVKHSKDNLQVHTCMYVYALCYVRHRTYIHTCTHLPTLLYYWCCRVGCEESEGVSHVTQNKSRRGTEQWSGKTGRLCRSRFQVEPSISITTIITTFIVSMIYIPIVEYRKRCTNCRLKN